MDWQNNKPIIGEIQKKCQRIINLTSKGKGRKGELIFYLSMIVACFYLNNTKYAL